MATLIGQVYGYDQNGTSYHMRMDIWLDSQSIALNQSYLHVDVSAIAAGGRYDTDVRAWYGTVSAVSTATGSGGASGNAAPNFSGGSFGLGSSGTITITHKSDGTAQITGVVGWAATIPGGWFDSGFYGTGGAWSLPTIPRATTPELSASSCEAGASINIVLTPATSGFHHRVKWGMGSLANKNAGLSGGSGSAGGTDGTNGYWQTATGTRTVAFSVPIDVLKQMINSATGTLVITVDTYNSSTLIGTKTVNLTITVPSSAYPTITSVSAVEATTSPDIASLVGAFVQSFSKLKLTGSGASGKYDATIPTVQFQVRDSTPTTLFDSGEVAASTLTSGAVTSVLTMSGTLTIRVRVKDSRGYWSNWATNTVTVLAYGLPQFVDTPTVERAANRGSVTITIASPGVVTLNDHGLKTGDKVSFETTGALPTGLTLYNIYYVIVKDANSFWLATNFANAQAETKINTSGSQSGTHSLMQVDDAAGTSLLLDLNIQASSLVVSATQKNHIEWQVKYMPTEGQTGAPPYTDPGYTADDSNHVISGVTFNDILMLEEDYSVNTSYFLTIIIKDIFSTIAYYTVVSKASTLMHWNGDLGIGFGSYHDGDLEIDSAPVPWQFYEQAAQARDGVTLQRLMDAGDLSGYSGPFDFDDPALRTDALNVKHASSLGTGSPPSTATRGIVITMRRIGSGWSQVFITMGTGEYSTIYSRTYSGGAWQTWQSEYATDAQAIARTLTYKGITPAGLDAAMKDRPIQGRIPSSVGVGSGSASVAADGTVNFSGASSIRLDGVFDGTGSDIYAVYMDAVRSVDTSGTVAWRLARGGAAYTTTDYRWTYDLNNNGSAASGVAVTQPVASGTFSAKYFQVEARLWHPFKSTVALFSSDMDGIYATGALQMIRTRGSMISASGASFDGIYLNTDSGTLTGSIKVVKIA